MNRCTGTIGPGNAHRAVGQVQVGAAAGGMLAARFQATQSHMGTGDLLQSLKSGADEFMLEQHQLNQDNQRLRDTTAQLQQEKEEALRKLAEAEERVALQHHQLMQGQTKLESQCMQVNTVLTKHRALIEDFEQVKHMLYTAGQWKDEIMGHMDARLAHCQGGIQDNSALAREMHGQYEDKLHQVQQQLQQQAQEAEQKMHQELHEVQGREAQAQQALQQAQQALEGYEGTKQELQQQRNIAQGLERRVGELTDQLDRACGEAARHSLTAQQATDAARKAEQQAHAACLSQLEAERRTAAAQEAAATAAARQADAEQRLQEVEEMCKAAQEAAEVRVGEAVAMAAAAKEAASEAECERRNAEKHARVVAEQHMQAQQQVEELSSKLADAKKEIAQQQQNVASLKQTEENLQEEVDVVHKELSRLEYQAAALQHEFADTKQKLEDARDIAAELRLSATQEGQRAIDAEGKLTQLQTVNATLQEQLDAAVGARAEAVQAATAAHATAELTIQSSRQEAERAAQTAKQTQEQLSAVQQRLQQANQLTGQLQTKHNELKADCEAMQLAATKVVAEAHKQVGSIRAAAEAAKAAQLAAEARLTEAKMQQSYLNDSLEEADRKLKEVEETLKTRGGALQHLTGEGDFDRQIEACKQLYQEKLTLREQVNLHEQQVAKLQEAVQRASLDSKQQEAHHAQQLANLQKQMQANQGSAVLSKENRELKAKLQQLEQAANSKAMHDGKVRVQMQQQIDELKQQLAEAAATSDKHNRDHLAEVNDLQEQVQQLQQEADRHAEEQEQHAQTQQELQSFKKQLLQAQEVATQPPTQLLVEMDKLRLEHKALADALALREKDLEQAKVALAAAKEDAANAVTVPNHPVTTPPLILSVPRQSPSPLLLAGPTHHHTLPAANNAPTGEKAAQQLKKCMPATNQHSAPPANLETHPSNPNTLQARTTTAALPAGGPDGLSWGPPGPPPPPLPVSPTASALPDAEPIQCPVEGQRDSEGAPYASEQPAQSHSLDIGRILQDLNNAVDGPVLQSSQVMNRTQVTQRLTHDKAADGQGGFLKPAAKPPASKSQQSVEPSRRVGLKRPAQTTAPHGFPVPPVRQRSRARTTTTIATQLTDPLGSSHLPPVGPRPHPAASAQMPAKPDAAGGPGVDTSLKILPSFSCSGAAPVAIANPKPAVSQGPAIAKPKPAMSQGPAMSSRSRGGRSRMGAMQARSAARAVQQTTVSLQGGSQQCVRENMPRQRHEPGVKSATQDGFDDLFEGLSQASKCK